MNRQHSRGGDKTNSIMSFRDLKSSKNRGILKV